MVDFYQSFGVLSTIVGILRSLLTKLVVPSRTSNNSELVPSCMMMFLAGSIIIAVPLNMLSISVYGMPVTALITNNNMP